MARPRAIAVAAILAATAGGAAWAWFGFGGADAGVRLMPDDPAVVARGQAVYRDHCAQCHGANLEGQANWRERLPSGRLPAPPHDRTGHTWHHPDAQLVDITQRGPAAVAGGGYQSDMPGFAGVLSDAEIVAVLSYIKGTWPAGIRARHDELNRQARADGR